MPYPAPHLRRPSKPPCASIVLQKAPPKPGAVPSTLFRLQRSLGNQTIQRLIQGKRLDPFHGILGLQPQLTVGGAGDKYEQEADQVATRMMTMPNSASPQSIQCEGIPEEQEEKLVQTKSLASPTTPLGQRQSTEEEQEQHLQAKYSSDFKRTTAQPDSSTEEEETLKMQSTRTKPFEAGGDVEKTVKQSQGGGSALPDPVRKYMEPRFGVDFSEVRVHQGSQSAKMNHALNAQAFTVGRDIYLGAGKTAGNSHLLAHELTHVVQQTGQPSASIREAPRAQRTCPACSTKKPGETSCLACTAPKASPHSLTGSQSIAKGSVLRTPSSTSNDCWSLKAKCYYFCTKSHLWKIPPDTEGFLKCKRGCCDWAFNTCQKNGTWPCVFSGM